MTPSYQSTQEPQWQESLFRLDRRIITSCVVLLLAAIVLGSAGCSKLRNENGTANTGGGQASASPENSNTTTAPPASAGEGTPTTWVANASEL